jgi:hypothetical protein
MSEKRKYLGKKRRKIFVIEKSLISQGTPKNLSVENENLSPIENIITSEELPTIKSSKINLNLSKKNEKNNLKIQKHSLINISNLVYDFLKKTVHTTGNDVTTHIKNIIQSNNNQPNQKNIQRRVYDAINVMCAVGLIKKNKQEIKFINYKNKNNSIKCINDINEEKEEEKSDETQEKINEKNNELQEKRNQLIKSYLTLKFYEKYNKLNKTNPLRMYENKLEFPFDLIIYDKTSDFHMQSKDDSSRYLLLSNSEFLHLNPYEIIKKLISYDIFLKLNENLNNVSENKSNSKKSTKSNSLIEEANSNIDKNKLISENYSQLNYTKKSKEEKDEDFIFEYLRNIKIFVDEIINNFSIQRKKENENNDETNKLEEEPDNIFEEKSINFLTGKKIRKNSNISNWSNFNEHNENNKINEDSISEITYFIQNFK